MSNKTNTAEHLVDIHQLATTRAHLGIVPLSKSAIYAKVKTGEFPAPFYLSPRKPVWDIHAIESWIEKQNGGVLGATCESRKSGERAMLSPMAKPDVSLRDQFAGQAMAGDFASHNPVFNTMSPRNYARWCYEVADLLMEARQ